jgi:hypothetical protein
MIIRLILIFFIIRISRCEGRSILISLYLICYLSIEWTIHVYTGTERFAGTDSNVYIRLFNLKNNFTSEYELTHENWIIGNDVFPLKNLFEYGEHDRFRISIAKFESIKTIHVGQTDFMFYSPA